MAHIYTVAENMAWQKTLPGKKCSANVVFMRDGKVLMVKAGYKDYWTFPGGIVDEGEAPLDAAIREAQEEVGVSLQPDELQFIAVSYSRPKNGFIDHMKFIYRTERTIEDGEINFVDQEIEDFKWIDLDEIAQYADNVGVYKKIGALLQAETQGAYVEV